MKSMVSEGRWCCVVGMLAAVVFVSGCSMRGERLTKNECVANAFGMHGPTYSHWLEGKRPHFWEEGDAHLRALADSGAGWARQDFWWGLCEPEQGRFVWDDFDRMFDAYERAGVSLMPILCYSSAWSGGVCPDTDEERARFANYVYEMVKRYKGRVLAWEIWNEPNIQPFWSPRPNPELYAKLLIAAYEAAKRADPDCTVVGCAFAGPDHEFLRGMYEHGVKGHFDVLSYHNYGQDLCIEMSWPGLEALRAVCAENGEPDKRIWHTENGFFTGPVGVSEQEQAARVVKFSVGLLALGVERTIQLTLADWTDDPKFHDLSVYRGLLHADFSPKQSYAAYQVMCHRLGGKKHVASIRPAPGVSGYLFEDDDESVLVMWRNGAEKAMPTPLHMDTPVLLTQKMNGDWRVQRNDKGIYVVPIGSDPVYAINPGKAVDNQRNVRWLDPVATSLAREADAVMEAEVSNPLDVPVTLMIGPDQRSDVRFVSEAVEPGETKVVRVAVDASKLEVGEHEFYWALKAKEKEDWVCQGRRLVMVESPLTLSFGSLKRLNAAGPTMPARIDYYGSGPATGSIVLRQDGQPSSSPVEFDLAPGESRTLELPLHLASFADRRAIPLELSMESAGMSLAVEAKRPMIACPKAPGGAAVDGDLSEWQASEPQIVSDMMSWEYVNATVDPSEEDLAVRGWVAYDDRGLWLALEVKDDVIDLPQSRAIWNWDSLQVALDMGSDAQPTGTFDDNDIEVELGGRVGEEPWLYLGYCPLGWPEEQLSAKLVGQVKVDAEAGVVNYELLIPAGVIASSTELEPGAVMGFSFMINDNDGTGRGGWMELTPGIGMGKKPSAYAWLWLR